MVEDATLNDFQSVEDDSPNGDTLESDIDPAAITYAYSPDGATCEACGIVVERRWSQGDSMVCSSCMEW
jgi:hypothetical protein